MDIKEALLKLPSFERYAVACSGGADSLALLHAASICFGPERVAALHFDHGIRGDESAEDAAFCEKFANDLGVKFFLGKAEAGLLADPPKGENQEALARKLRYLWFAEVCEKENIPCLLTAHHADDVAETMLMHLMRGSGLKGLAGLNESAKISELFKDIACDLTVCRPLLELRAKDCVDYCLEHKLSYRTDSTNSDQSYLRNWLRHEIIPKLRERAGGDITLKFRRTARQLGEQREFIREAALDFLRRNALSAAFGTIVDSSAFLDAKPALQREVLRILAAEEENWDFETLDKVLNCLKDGTEHAFQPAGGVRWLSVGEKIVFYNEQTSLKEFFQSALKIKKAEDRGRGYSDNGSGWLAWLKGEAVTYREYLRADDYALGFFSNGLRYAPTNGPERKVGDMMTDAKIPLFLRRDLPILFSKDSPAWIAGWRIAKSAAVEEGDEIVEATLELPSAKPWNGNEGGDVC